MGGGEDEKGSRLMFVAYVRDVPERKEMFVLKNTFNMKSIILPFLVLFSKKIECWVGFREPCMAVYVCKQAGAWCWWRSSCVTGNSACRPCVRS